MTLIRDQITRRIFPNHTFLGDELRKRRLQLKLSQIVEVPKEYVSNWEANRYQPRSIITSGIIKAVM